MLITRGIKTLSQGYQRNIPEIPDTEEYISNSVVLESDGTTTVEVISEWPSSITLTSSISSISIRSNCTVERIDNGKSVGTMSIYNSPSIDTHSIATSPHMYCKKIIVDFDRAGTADINDQRVQFMGEHVQHFHIETNTEHLLEKSFLTSETPITERFTTNAAGITALESSSAKCQLHPYGGLYQYGIHPQRIEQCVFRTVHDGRHIALRISSISELQGIDVFKTEPNSKIRGIAHSAATHKLSLYDELKMGMCSITITNTITEEHARYVSHAVAHIPNTNIININFIKE